MGYYANGSFTLEFRTAADRDAAFAELKSRSVGWHAQKATTFYDFVNDVWGTNMAGDPAEGEPLIYNGWVDEKFLTAHTDFAKAVTPYTATFSAEFVGEDQYMWCWTKGQDGQLCEESMTTISFSEVNALREAKSLADQLVQALNRGATDSDLVRIVKTSLVGHLPAATLTSLATDADEVVRDAVSGHVLRQVET